MKQEYRFTGSRSDKEKQALAATKFYLGTARFLQVLRKMTDWLKDSSTAKTRAAKYREIRFMCELLGVRGYFPVRAVARQVLPRV